MIAYRVLNHWHERLMQRQTCKACGHSSAVDFVVSDRTWDWVVPGRLQRKTLCLTCFERFAAHQSIHLVRVFLPGGP